MFRLGIVSLCHRQMSPLVSNSLPTSYDDIVERLIIDILRLSLRVRFAERPHSRLFRLTVVRCDGKFGSTNMTSARVEASWCWQI